MYSIIQNIGRPAEPNVELKLDIAEIRKNNYVLHPLGSTAADEVVFLQEGEGVILHNLHEELREFHNVSLEAEAVYYLGRFIGPSFRFTETRTVVSYKTLYWYRPVTVPSMFVTVEKKLPVYWEVFDGF